MSKQIRLRCPLSLLLISAFATAFLGPFVEAGQWYDQPSVTMRLGYDDNVRFTKDDEDSSFSQRISASAGVGYRTEITDIQLKGRADVDRYSEESDLDTDDEYLYLIAGHRSGLNLFRLNGQFVRDTSRTSELETTGRVDKSKRRYSGLINPSWTRTLSERASLLLGYSYNKVTYEDSSTTGLFDYRYHGAEGTLYYALDEVTQFSTTLTYTHYKVPATDSKAEDYGIQFGVSRSLSDTLTMNLAVGGRATTSKGRDGSGRSQQDTNYGTLINGSLEKKFESTTLQGRVSRELRPSGSGRLIDSRMVGIDLTHDLSERLRFSLGATLYRNETNNNSFNRGDDEQRTYVSLQPSLRWRLTRWWDVTGSYRFRYQEYDGTSDNYESNAVFLYLTYNWPRESVARWSEL